MSITKKIEYLGALTKLNLSHQDYVDAAFTLGLWYKSLPEYAQEDVDTMQYWGLHQDLVPRANSNEYSKLFKFQFISETGSSWHQCYRDFRELGWKRKAVHRKDGILKYLFELSDSSKPEGYQRIHLVLEISISTCKQVQVGVKEVPVMETRCEDLVELFEDEIPSPPSPSPDEIPF